MDLYSKLWQGKKEKDHLLLKLCCLILPPPAGWVANQWLTNKSVLGLWHPLALGVEAGHGIRGVVDNLELALLVVVPVPDV